MTWEILHGDCRDVMATLAPDSFDAVCTDPPYGIEALAGYGGSAAEGTGFGNRPTAWVDGRGWNLKRCRDCGRLPHGGAPCRCESPLLMTSPERWREYQAWCQTWAAQAFRVMKPGALMRWLVRLVTPKGGHILDPFAGSGTTGIAALHEGFTFTGMERDAAHVMVAKQRVWYNSVHVRTKQREDAMTDPDDDLLTMQDAARLLGMGRSTFWRKVREEAIPVYQAPANRRVRLVKRSDLARLTTPVLAATPVAPSEKE